MTTNNQNSQYEEWDVEVAKRIACAVISYQSDLTFEEAWNQYGNQIGRVGTFWLSVARRIREELPQKPK